MENQKDTDKESQKPLSRKQERARQRAEKEAAESFIRITDQIFKSFTESVNPESEEITDLMKRADAQWRLVCSRRKYMPHAYPLVKNFCDKLVDDYKKALVEGEKV